MKYARTQFKDYTHRFIVELSIDEDWRNDRKLDIYSDSDSFEELEAFINEKKSDKVLSFKIVHRASKEQDEANSKLIQEFLKDL